MMRLGGRRQAWLATGPGVSGRQEALEAFTGKAGRRTVFNISAMHAVDVMAYSAFGALEKGVDAGAGRGGTDSTARRAAIGQGSGGNGRRAAFGANRRDR